MTNKQVSLDGQVLWAGIRRASARTRESILCMVTRQTLTLVVRSGLRLLVTWRYPLRQRVSQELLFTIPAAIASLLRDEVFRRPLQVQMDGPRVSLTFHDEQGTYELRWSGDPGNFSPPEGYAQMFHVPAHMVEVSYLSISDAAHQAVAKLISLEQADVPRTKLAILVDFSRSRLSINGQEIEGGEPTRYYFDPRLIIRALEIVRTDVIKVGVTPLPDQQRGYLSIVAEEPGCFIHCALLSIGTETQKLYPLPPGRNQ